MRARSLLTVVCVIGCATGAEKDLSDSRARPVVMRVGDSQLALTSNQFISGDRIAVPVAEVWAVLPKVYNELEIPIGTVDSRAWLLGNDAVELRHRLGDTRLSRLLNCGTRPAGGPTADRYAIVLSVRTQLTPVEDGDTVVRTTVQATASPRSASGSTIPCTTTGRLEQDIAERITELTTAVS